MDFASPAIYGFALVLFRTSGLCVTAPILGSQPVPARIRLGLALILALAAYTGAGAPAALLPSSLWGIAVAGAAETLIGVVAGFCARMVLEAASTAGQLAGLSMGIGYSSVLDPFSGHSSSATAELFSLAALGAAVAAGIHREAFAWLCHSFIEIPPGNSIDIAALASQTIVQAIHAIGLAIRVAFPILAAITLGHMVLATMGRLAPQLNLQSIGFSVAVLAGGGAIWLVTPAVARVVAQSAMATFSH